MDLRAPRSSLSLLVDHVDWPSLERGSRLVSHGYEGLGRTCEGRWGMSSERAERRLTRREVMAGATVAVAGATLGAHVPGSRAAGLTRADAVEGPVWRHGGALAQRGVDIPSVAGREAE